MTKENLIDQIAADANINKSQAKKVLQSVINSIKVSTSGRSISGKGSRSFNKITNRHPSSVQRPKRRILDPQRTGNYTLGEIREAIISTKAV